MYNLNSYLNFLYRGSSLNLSVLHSVTHLLTFFVLCLISLKVNLIELTWQNTICLQVQIQITFLNKISLANFFANFVSVFFRVSEAIYQFEGHFFFLVITMIFLYDILSYPSFSLFVFFFYLSVSFVNCFAAMDSLSLLKIC